MALLSKLTTAIDQRSRQLASVSQLMESKREMFLPSLTEKSEKQTQRTTKANV